MFLVAESKAAILQPRFGIGPLPQGRGPVPKQDRCTVLDGIVGMFLEGSLGSLEGCGA